MSKPEGAPHAPWDAHKAFHDATMVVYGDLGTLISALRKAAPGTALKYLDWVLERHAAIDPGVDDVAVDIAKGVRLLRVSMATVEDIRKAHPGVGGTFWRRGGIDNSFGGVHGGSAHDVVTGVADALLEIARGSGAMKETILRTGTSSREWTDLREALEHEFRLTSILPLSSTPGVDPVVQNSAPSLRSETPGDASTVERPRLDEHVERAFDLLGHYQGFICKPHGERTNEDHRALSQLEQVLRQWLPLARAAGDPVINGVAAVVGNHEAATRLLRDVRLWSIRKERLQIIAATAFAEPLIPIKAVAVCRRELDHWRNLLPHIWRTHSSASVDTSAQLKAKSYGGYWSMHVEARPSYLGASYSLACACGAIADAAAGMKIAGEVFRPAIHLAVALRANPWWALFESIDAVRVLDDQLALATQVEHLMAEMTVLLKASRATEQPSTNTNTTPGVQPGPVAAEQVAGAPAAVDATSSKFEQDLLRLHAESPWGKAMLAFLWRQPGMRASTAQLLEAGIAAAETRDTERKKTVQDTLRVLRTTCRRAGGCPPCSDHLGLIDYPTGKTRGTLLMTPKGVAIAEAQKRDQ
jgi:hypothetical protein